MSKSGTQRVDKNERHGKRHPELRLLPGGRRPRRFTTRTVIAATLGVFAIIALSLVRASIYQQKSELSSSALFNTLHEAFRSQGLIAFNQQKSELRKAVRNVLESGDVTPETAMAENIAVYLFPDLLSDENFEKPIGLDQWLPLERVIESSPRTPESRAMFNELRSNIWNYENPDRAFPNLSETAKQVIRIYENLSAP